LRESTQLSKSKNPVQRARRVGLSRSGVPSRHLELVQYARVARGGGGSAAPATAAPFPAPFPGALWCS